MEFIYKALKGTLEHVPVTEEEVDRQLVRLQQTPRIRPVTDRPARNGDEVVLDYAGYCGGVQFEHDRANHCLTVTNWKELPQNRTQVYHFTSLEQFPAIMTRKEAERVAEALRHASRILHLGAEHFDGTAAEYRQSPLYRRLMGGESHA